MARDIVVDLGRGLPDQEQASRYQDQVAPGESMAEQGEQRLGELHDESDARQQRQPQDHRQPDTDAARVGAPILGSLLVRMEMKIRLSMPSTTSMTTSVASRPGLGAGRRARGLPSCPGT
jgi:hypothetical protein